MTDRAGAAKSLHYTVDEQDRIVELGGQWDAMQTPGGQRMDARKAVVGQPLWGFILNEGLKSLYKLLMTRVRKTGRVVTFPYRCDTPEMRRLARLQLQPVDSGRVRFVSDILETEARLAPLTLEYAPHCQPLIRSCSICSHLQYGEEWLPAEIVAEQHLGVMSENSFRVAHAVCDPCLKAVMSMGTGDDARGTRAILGRAWH